MSLADRRLCHTLTAEHGTDGRFGWQSAIGYSDILVEVPDNRTGIVIELKYAENGNMDTACEEALKQIEDRDYTARLRDDGMRNIIKYGIACYKKNCKVVLG